MKKVIPALTAAIAIMTQTSPIQAASAPGAVFAKPFTETVHGTAPFSQITNAD